MSRSTPQPVATVGSGEVGSAAWWAEWAQRSASRRPRHDGLTSDRVIMTALALIDADGLEAMTVRRLAAELATGSASLYRHIASRDELLVLIVDHVLGDIVLPVAALPGRTRVEQLAAELRRVLIAHPNLLPALAASPLLGPNAIRGAEFGLGSMLDAGYGTWPATAGYLAMIDYILGTVYFDTSRAGRTLPDQIGEIDVPTADAVFTFGVTAFLDGLDSRFPPAS
ncbi:MAG: TetR/AcrR family transcriptional regulator [Ilumatobacteraceae bacterium]